MKKEAGLDRGRGRVQWGGFKTGPVTRPGPGRGRWSGAGFQVRVEIANPSLGRATKECPLTKSAKPTISVYVRKNQPPALESSDMECSGLNMRDHQVVVQDLVTEFRLHFIALLETRVMPSNDSRLQAGLLSRWRWLVDYSGPVYGANDVSSRRELWQGLTDLAVSVDLLWLVGGDFNAVFDMSEVSGALGDIRVAMNEFNDCILQTGLIPLPMQGERFSWHNCSTDGRSLWKRLDRMFVNDAWMERWPNLFYTCLTPRTSDHSPLVLKGDSRDVQVSMFWFDNYLALSPEFLASVNNIWQHPVIGTPMYSVTRKLKALKPVFHQQQQKKGDLEMNVKLASGFLEVAQKLLQVDRHNSLLLQLENCCRRASKRIFQISDDDGLVQTDPTTISSVFVAYFQGLLGGTRTDRVLDLHYLRPWARHILTDEEARALIRPITIDDVKTTMFDIEEDKAPGPDGFSSGRLLKQVNATLLTLIPKCRLPPRCALKVDLRKAYDTVEWDFLFATLRMFGFPAVFIRWIEECVTSAHFSIYVNGGVHGFFAGARGLRQGTPCHHCQPLLQKIDNRIKGWEGVQLSFAGRVQLIKFVLVSLEVYWAMTFVLPKGIIKEMIKRLGTFLWKGTSSGGYPKVAWEVVCRPVEEGGQGIEDILPSTVH
ncbi:UNVERIFIED_CONTAM: hypothetical protein Sangu_0828100 [Sesamum angustifolium]|uniref:Reverse transcriptase domain-containing protein n=1 Tax=Sesamum angustifolium TaxID=2727405 RepID=A0AAW2PWA7_9LAMI